MRDGVGPEREIPGVHRRVDETGGGVERGVDVAAALAVAGAAAVTAAPVLVVLEPVGRHAGAIGRHHPAHRREFPTQHDLGRVEPARPLEPAVGQVGQVLRHARNAEVEIDLVVVWFQVPIRDRPVFAVAVPGLGFEVVVG